MTVIRDTVRSSYLGYPLTITDRAVIVHSPRFVKIGEFASLATARRKVREHRGRGGRAT